MSLINDALKRANQSHKQPVRPRPPLAPMQPVETIRRPAAWPSFLVPALLVVVLTMAGWFLRAWWQSQQGLSGSSVAVVTPQPQPVPPAVKTTAALPAPIAPTDAPAVPAVAIRVNTNLVVRSNPPAKPADLPGVELAKAEPAASPVQPPVVPTETKSPTFPPPVSPSTNSTPTVSEKTAAKAVFPEMKLQGIFYRATKPSALINGRTLFTNEKVEGVKVIAIERLSVTLEFEGERKVLSLD